MSIEGVPVPGSFEFTVRPSVPSACVLKSNERDLITTSGLPTRFVWFLLMYCEMIHMMKLL